MNNDELKRNGWLAQKQKGKYVLRIHVTGGHFTGEQLRAVADVAREYGHDYVHFTSRQSLELPWIDREDLETVQKTLELQGVEPSAIGPRVRTITACQGNATCNSAAIDTYALACELDDLYFGKDLPSKFKIGITGCRNNCLKTEENDLGIKGVERVSWNEENCVSCGICVKACRSGAITMRLGTVRIDPDVCIRCGRCAHACPVGAISGTPGYLVTFCGSFGNHFHMGEPVVPVIEDHDTLLRVCDAAIRFFAEHARPKDRLYTTVERVGNEEFETCIREAYEG
ncbi:MAG: 4Fe-4S binding protein [Clostridia bacterium]|nr:4Fe-4S binding protein [Clostridia bacterium]